MPEEKDKEQKPKIIVDDDWKAEAQREKERLAREVEQQAQVPQGEVAAPPKADFAGLVNVLTMQALVSLGGVRSPSGQVIPPNLDLAKYYIDLLDVLEQKCRNNLTEEEKRLLDVTLYELRMRYVQAVSASGVPGAGPVGPEAATGGPEPLAP